ncbi:unnamed protein product [Cuscuta campestris]|uniref:Uncharacterized protein n=1 Tax=Cuscuta campestris TaxID=132261 RepID=A0A484LC85_9ASTE|nr:unnamed protein product [Cuscuta campestris]
MMSKSSTPTGLLSPSLLLLLTSLKWMGPQVPGVALSMNRAKNRTLLQPPISLKVTGFLIPRRMSRPKGRGPVILLLRKGRVPTRLPGGKEEEGQAIRSRRGIHRSDLFIPGPETQQGINSDFPPGLIISFAFTDKLVFQVGVLSEEVGRSLLESKDQVSELTFLLDSAKLEINDQAEREKRLEEELNEERARLDEERAKLAEEKRKVAELEEALGQAEESVRAKEQSFLDDAATWAACHHTEVARSVLTKPEDTMDFFKTMYKEPEGMRMITEIGSYGFQCGQKDERSLLYARLQKRDPSFDPVKMKLPPLYKEEPAPPFPLQ